MSDLVSFVEERIERIGLNVLARSMRRRTLRNLDIQNHILLIQDNGTPVGVLLGYHGFLELQNGLRDGSALASRLAGALNIPTEG